MDPVKTLQDLIDYKTTYNLDNFTLFEKYDNQIIPSEYIIDRYYDIIDIYKESYKVDPSGQLKYKYKVKQLSKDLYGTPDLYWLILYLNNIESPSRFKPYSKLILISPDNIEKLFSILYNKNREDLEKNHSELGIE